MSHSLQAQRAEQKRRQFDYDEAEAAWEIAERARLDRLDQAEEVNEDKEQS